MQSRRSSFLSNIVENLQSSSSIPSDTKSIRRSSSKQVSIALQTKALNDSTLIDVEKLVGRDQQLQILLKCYERMIAKQKLEIVLIHGTSGSGKSSLFKEFIKNLPSEVLCGHGKFDQLHSHGPYSAIVTASNQLCQKMFKIPNSGKIRDRIRSLLGPDINLLGNLITGLSELTSDNSNNCAENLEENKGKSFTRFKLLFRAFLRSLASPENPLIIFLDDLQWADIASLEVLKSIISDRKAHNTMILCAFREGEMTEEVLRKYYLTEQSLIRDESSNASEVLNSNTTDIFLDCLDEEHLNELISLKLGMEKSSTESLSQLIWKKTHGNPFYALNFLSMLHRNSLITNDMNNKWIWDESKVLHTTNVSDNIASILVSKVQSLSEQVRSILQMASFIGYEFPLTILVTIVYEEQDTIATEIIFERRSKQMISDWITAALKVAVDEGLLEKTSQLDHYKFAHDKIQEVLYEALMPEEIERQLLHQRIGTLIWDSVQDKEMTQINDWIVFLAADNLNRAVGLVDYSGDRFYLVELNVTAAKRMIQKSAFLVASEYLRIAVSLLELNTCWDERYDLCLNLFNTAAEVEKIIGSYARSKELVGLIHKHAKHLHHRSSAFEIELDALVMQGNVRESFLLGFTVLRQFGVKFPRKINILVVAKEVLVVRVLQGRRKLQDLLSIKENTDEKISLCLSVMSTVAMNAFLLGSAYKEIFAVVCLRMFRMTMIHGISMMESPMAIVGWGTLNAALGRFDVSKEAERLSFDLVEKYNLDSLKGSIVILNYLFNHFWRENLDSDSRDEFFRAYKLATNYGHIRVAQYGFIAWVDTAMYLDDNLSGVHPRTRSVVSEMQELESTSCLMILLPIWQVLLNLSGDSYNVDPTRLRGEALDEDFACSIKDIDSNVVHLSLHMMESIVSYVFDDDDFMRKNLWLITKHESVMRGHFTTGYFQTWLAIFHYESFYLTGKRIHRRFARMFHRRVHIWSTTGTGMLLGPNCFLNAMKNLCVEKSSVEDLEFRFQEAANVCNNSQCRLFESLAYERLAKALRFHESEGARHDVFQNRAVELYRTWGAFEKANRLEKKPISNSME